MPPKPGKCTTNKSSTYDSEDTYISARSVTLVLRLEGEMTEPGDFLFITIYNGQVVLDGKWQKDAILDTELPINLKEEYYQNVVIDRPLIFILRALGGKGAKDPDPLLHIDNRAGATVDLYPLLIGEEEIFTKVQLAYITSGDRTNCAIHVRALASEPLEGEDTRIPLMLTMLSAHCVPVAKEGTVYMGAIGLDGVLDPIAVNFGMSVSSAEAEKVVWATASNGGYAANTAYSVPNDDVFFPDDLYPENDNDCRSFYWNAMRRVRVDQNLLRSRLSCPLVFELAGVPRTGKIDVRGRYMAFVDAGVLLEPGVYGASVATKLLFYSEAELPDNVGALLELPPSSAKVSARDSDLIMDEFGHSAYIVLRFDICDPLIPKIKIAALYDTIGLLPSEGRAGPVDDLDVEPPPEDPTIDVRKIRKESGALAVHKELSGLACRGAVPMNQGIKRTAANRLLMRVRNMLKQFPPGDCSYIEWQDTVTRQHAASRRAVTSSFAPQPPPIRPPPRFAAARCRMAGDDKIANKHITANLKSAAGSPRSLLAKALRCLEARNDLDAKNYILEGLGALASNKYLLWIYGGQEFDKGVEGTEMAAAAFRIAVKGNYSDGTANAIGWAALHTLHHCNENLHSAFIAAKKMRKSYELPREWKKFLKRWTDLSGEEEVFWIPGIISSANPMLIAAAFFLCLRCYKFADKILHCVEIGCTARGSRFGTKENLCPDIYYLRAASWILRRQFDKALEVVTQGIVKFGPNPMMTQMRATCLICARGWDGECAKAIDDAEKAGSEPCPSILLAAALGRFKTDPQAALQRAARAHKLAPCAHSALVISRIYTKLDEASLAERWAAAAVKSEPLLADGWAVLALLAMNEKNLDKARTMLRTARQVGSISADIELEVKKIGDVVQVEVLPDSLVKNLCLCEYY